MELALRQLNELEARIGALRALSPVTRERLAADSTLTAAVERHLHVAIQAAIDVASWVIADRFWREPRSYRDTFDVLAEAGFLDRPTAFRIADMASFRNALVHGYDSLSTEDTVRFATEGLADLEAFAARCVEEYQV